MAQENEVPPNPNAISDEERAFAQAVYDATNSGGKYPDGHPFAGLTKEEALAKQNEARQNPPQVVEVSNGEPRRIATPQATLSAEKKDAAVKKD